MSATPAHRHTRIETGIGIIEPDGNGRDEAPMARD